MIFHSVKYGRVSSLESNNWMSKTDSVCSSQGMGEVQNSLRSHDNMQDNTVNSSQLPDALQVLLGQLGWPAAKDAGDSMGGQSEPPAQAPIIQGPGHRPAQEEFQAQLITLQVVRQPLAARIMAAWLP